MKESLKKKEKLKLPYKSTYDRRFEEGFNTCFEQVINMLDELRKNIFHNRLSSNFEHIKDVMANAEQTILEVRNMVVWKIHPKAKK